MVGRVDPPPALQVAAAAAAELTGLFAAAWNRLGLDLASVAAHTPERLLSSILDPDANNPPRYDAFTCTLQDGENDYGLVADNRGSGIGDSPTQGVADLIAFLRGPLR